jgi:hypothetical protein
MDSSTKMGYGIYTIVLFNENGEKCMFPGRESTDHTAKGQAEVILIFKVMKVCQFIFIFCIAVILLSDLAMCKDLAY